MNGFKFVGIVGAIAVSLFFTGIAQAQCNVQQNNSSQQVNQAALLQQLAAVTAAQQAVQQPRAVATATSAAPARLSTQFVGLPAPTCTSGTCGQSAVQAPIQAPPVRLTLSPLQAPTKGVTSASAVATSGAASVPVLSVPFQTVSLPVSVVDSNSLACNGGRIFGNLGSRRSTPVSKSVAITRTRG